MKKYNWRAPGYKPRKRITLLDIALVVVVIVSIVPLWLDDYRDGAEAAYVPQEEVITIEHVDPPVAAVPLVWVVEESAEEPQYISLGTFKVYAYCPCARCCGKSDGITATGTAAAEGRTIAVDPSVIPLGSRVIIDGHEYIAEDTGGGITGRTIDKFYESHEEALEWGIVYTEIFVYTENK